jgi:hypothetical protein
MIDLAKACRYNPFDGDFGDVGDRTLRDKIVTFRFPHDCCLCPATIKKGERGRSLTKLWVDGSPAPVATYRYCEACTKAMATVFEDYGKALDARPVRGAPLFAD